MLLYSIDVLMAQDQSQPQQLQLQQQQYLTSQAQLQQQQQQQQQCMQQTDSNLSAASYHSSGGASDEHPTHSTEQVCLPPTYLKFVFFIFTQKQWIAFACWTNFLYKHDLILEVENRERIW